MSEYAGGWMAKYAGGWMAKYAGGWMCLSIPVTLTIISVDCLIYFDLRFWNPTPYMSSFTLASDAAETPVTSKQHIACYAHNTFP